MKKRLFIIGNGFDIEHDLSTKYSDFLEFIEYGEGVELGGTGFAASIEYIYGIPVSYFWNDFERNLGELSVEAVVENAIVQRDDFNSEFDYESVNDDAIINHLERYYFHGLKLLDDLVKKWSENVEISQVQPKEKYSNIFNGDSLFLTFNYTMVLEEIYDIPEENIFHIHGSVYDEPIMGHGGSRLDFYNGNQEKNDFLTEEFKEVVSNQIIEFYNSSNKDISKIKNNIGVWLEHKDLAIEEIYVLGHSLGEVDYPYFEFISDELNSSNWFISYFGENDKMKKEQHLAKLRFVSRNIELVDSLLLPDFQ